MRNLFFSLLIALSFFHCIPAYTQVAGENAESELLSTDQTNGKLYYKVIPFTLKKGQKALFFMQSNVFKPNIFLSTQTGELIRPGAYNEVSKEVQVSFAPSSDTSFMILFTSAEENKTGKFSSGYRILDSAQTVFKEEYSFCERFAYLFNQWQLEWQVMPTERGILFDLEERLANPNSPIEYTAAKYSLMGGKARLGGNYQEILYSAVRDSTEACLAFYKKIIKDIKSCLDQNSWNIEEGEKKEVSGETELENWFYQTTYFYSKESNKEGHLQSFKITREGPRGVFSAHNSKVFLVFN